MKQGLLKLLTDAFTGLDNTTFDFMRLFCAFGILIYLILSALAFALLKQWSPLEFAGGFSTVVAGATGGVYAHDRSVSKHSTASET